MIASRPVATEHTGGLGRRLNGQRRVSRLARESVLCMSGPRMGAQRSDEG